MKHKIKVILLTPMIAISAFTICGGTSILLKEMSPNSLNTPVTGNHITLPQAFGGRTTISLTEHSDSVPTVDWLLKTISGENHDSKFFPNQVTLSNITTTTALMTANANSCDYIADSTINVNWTAYNTKTSLKTIFPVTQAVASLPVFGKHIENLEYTGQINKENIQVALKSKWNNLNWNQISIELVPANAPDFIAVKSFPGSPVYSDESYIGINTSNTIFTPINMTQDEQDGYTAICSSWLPGAPEGGPAYNAFFNNNRYWHYNTGRNGSIHNEYIGIITPSPHVCTQYSFIARRYGDAIWQTPITFELQGSNDNFASSVQLDRKVRISQGSAGCIETFSIGNTESFSSYRLWIEETYPPTYNAPINCNGNCPILTNVVFTSLDI